MFAHLPRVVRAAALAPFTLALLLAPALAAAAWTPSVDWGRYINGGRYDDVQGVTTNDQGEIFVTGQTNSFGTFEFGPNLPGGVTGGNKDAFVLKFNPNGTLAWARVFGGSSDDSGQEVALGPDGAVYVVGKTGSSQLKTGDGTTLVTQVGTNPNTNADAFLARVEPDGTLSWLMFLGGTGTDEATDVAVDASATASGGTVKVYVAGKSTSGEDFSGYVGGRYTSNSNRDAFVSQVELTTPVKPEIRWTRFVGSSEHDDAYAVAVHRDGQAIYVGGIMGDLVSNLPAGMSSIASWGSGDNDGFVARLDASGTVQWFTYVGGSGDDSVRDLLMRPTGTRFVVMGNAKGSSSFPGPGNGAGDDVFVLEMDERGFIQARLRLGKEGSEVADSHAAMDKSGNVFVGGKTTSSDSLLVNPWDDQLDGDDGFVLMVSADLKTVLWATYLGGTESASATDISGHDWVRGLAATDSGRLIIGGHSSAQDLPLISQTGAGGSDSAAENGFLCSVVVDSTPPSLLEIRPALDPEGYLTATWNFVDDESGVVNYAWAITVGDEPQPSPEAFKDTGTTTSGTERSFKPEVGKTYFVWVTATNGSGVERVGRSVGGLTVEPAPVPDGGNGGGDGGGDGVVPGPGTDPTLAPVGWDCGGAGGGSLTGAFALMALAMVSQRRSFRDDEPPAPPEP